MTSQPVFRLSLQLARVAAYIGPGYVPLAHARPTMFYIPLVLPELSGSAHTQRKVILYGHTYVQPHPLVM